YLNNRVDKLTARKRIKSLQTIAVSKSHIRKRIQCAVCLEDFHLRQKVKSLPCKHFYHKRCITPWLEKNNTCPSCRKFVDVLPKRHLVRSF
ncbi:E3 ubiquitin-protein ligase RNF115, partial [Stegodyphus mimosarum]